LLTFILLFFFLPALDLFPRNLLIFFHALSILLFLFECLKAGKTYFVFFFPVSPFLNPNCPNHSLGRVTEIPAFSPNPFFSLEVEIPSQVSLHPFPLQYSGAPLCLAFNPLLASTLPVYPSFYSFFLLFWKYRRHVSFFSPLQPPSTSRIAFFFFFSLFTRFKSHPPPLNLISLSLLFFVLPSRILLPRVLTRRPLVSLPPGLTIRAILTSSRHLLTCFSNTLPLLFFLVRAPELRGLIARSGRFLSHPFFYAPSLPLMLVIAQSRHQRSVAPDFRRYPPPSLFDSPRVEMVDSFLPLPANPSSFLRPQARRPRPFLLASEISPPRLPLERWSIPFFFSSPPFLPISLL